MKPGGDPPTLTKASSGDPAPAGARREADASFEAFFRGNATRLYRAMYLVARDAGEAEELVQEAFVRVWERWGHVRTMDDPIGYLYRAAMNGQRSRWRRRAVQSKHADIDPIPAPDLLGQVDERLEVVRVLRTLPARMRAALVLTDYLGCSVEQTAEILGVRASTVRSHASQARTSLRERIGEHDE